MREYHQPVMAAESIEGLKIHSGGIYVDATFGGGGHSKLILDKLGDNGRLLAFDQDEEAARNAPEDPRLIFISHNFRFMKRFLKLHRVKEVDGILADLGVSSHQLDEAERGFSYRFESELDMRMNRQQEQTAAFIINNYPQEELQRIFSEYGEVRNARTLAERLVTERQVRPIKTIGNLLSVVEPLVRGKRARYLSQLFQALRIEVNDEMGALEDFLNQALELLVLGGRLVVIAYHSVEDRMVKNFLKTGNVHGRVERDFYGNIYRPFRLIPKKALQPSKAEVDANPRARSARLRIGERKKSNFKPEAGPLEG
jgi:16S rRNA (cytosine1402-N4)-methyltransferase